jgi:hypothetical protein
MVLLGTLTKRKAAWIATCEAIGAITQAGTRESAIASLADAVEILVDKKGSVRRCRTSAVTAANAPS